MGTVVQFEPTGALVDIGAKATAYMPAREVRTENTLQATKQSNTTESDNFRITGLSRSTTLAQAALTAKIVSCFHLLGLGCFVSSVGSYENLL